MVPSGSPRRVVIVERRLTHYRVPLYERLRELLAERQIDLAVLVGTATPEELAKRDGGHLPWATVIPTHYFLSGSLCWQRFNGHLHDIDLVVMDHQNKLLYNHWLLCGPRRFRVALWGHGRNMQGHAGSLSERFKRWTISKADWYFAYTQISVDVVASAGFPVARITNLNNSIDTSNLSHDRDSIAPGEIAVLKRDLGLTGKPVGVFIGSLFAEKRLDFLLEAGRRIRRRLPEFQCLIIGDGPEREKIRKWTAAHDWVHWVGARRGREKALFLGCAEVMLNPGMVGLGILDSFVLGIPLVTTDCGIHSPEIAYLRSGENGVMTPDNVDAFAVAVSALLGHPVALAGMRQGCVDSARDFRIETMADRFADGIVTALATPRQR
ncbi:MAG TPA: glycosyltransferase family 4 protein [Gemmatimonadales bacterium]|nr:glycosyltransferase family 4 protein [Gemmatimonadales bacterium]